MYESEDPEVRAAMARIGRAQDVGREAEVNYFLLLLVETARYVRKWEPRATHIRFEPSDQEGCNWSVDALLAGEEVLDDEFDEVDPYGEFSGPLTDLPAHYPNRQHADGWGPDERFECLTYTSRPWTLTVDVDKALQIEVPDEHGPLPVLWRGEFRHFDETITVLDVDSMLDPYSGYEVDDLVRARARLATVYPGDEPIMVAIDERIAVVRAEEGEGS